MLLILRRSVCLLPILIIHIKSVTYKQYLVEEKLCTKGFSPKLIEIGRDNNSGALVEEVNFFGTLSNKGYNCKFKVESTFDMGVFAVIQKLKFRKNTTTGECIDYIQFRHANPFQIGVLDLNVEKLSTQWGEKHCGEINALEIDLYALDPTDPKKLLPHAFVDTKGKVEIRIFISNETIPEGTNLDLKIAFTAYHVCKFNIGKYKKCGADACIWDQFFNDDILNCPFTNCADEGGCQIYYESGGMRPSTGLATKVMVGAVAGVFTMFVVFVMFLWLFRHCNLCWNDTPQTAQNTTQMRPVPTMEDIQQPSAPPRSPSMDKDLPPSYESLFPNT